MKTYECSSRGDTRFSALYAKLSSRGGRTIEEIYQTDIKGYPSIRAGKGRPGKFFSFEIQLNLYEQLWREYLSENPALRVYLKALLDEGYVLVDSFAKPGAANQAAMLMKILK